MTGVDDVCASSLAAWPAKCLNTRHPVPGRAKCPFRYLMSAFIAMRATDPPQDLLYFVRDPWPWGKPHEAAGIHHHCWWRGGRVAARGVALSRVRTSRFAAIVSDATEEKRQCVKLQSQPYWLHSE